MLDGLAPVAQAALHLGNTDVIAFESDRATWEAAADIIAKEITKLQGTERMIQKKSKAH